MPLTPGRERFGSADFLAQERRRTWADSFNLSVVLGVCCLFAWLRWAKLDELLWGDPVHWLHEVSRVAGGELPYRDFSFQYPPFTAFFFGWGMRWFGATFVAASVLINFWSFAVMLLCYALSRFLLPAALRLPACFLLVCVGVTSLTNFNLFSYRIYTPALETGAAGALLSLLGMLRILRGSGMGGMSLAMIGIGSGVAFLSKPEFALADACALLLFALVNGRRWWNLTMLAVGILPAAALYGWLAEVVGARNLMAGVSGYGLATFACPWWPTGLGLFGVASALGEAMLAATILSFPWRADFERYYGTAYRLVRILAIPGTIIFLAYIALLNRNALTGSQPIARKIALILPSLVWTAPVLLPVMWTLILLFFFLLTRRPRNREWLMVLIFPVVMSSRTWFGSTQGVTADIAAACYPFLLILAPWLLWTFLSRPSPKIPAVPVVAAIAILYSIARLAGGASLLTNGNFRTLETAAGPVRISGDSPAAGIYRYVAEHSQASDYVLEIPYGGGINFASGRRNPIFDTMLFNMEIPPEYQQRDLERIAQHPPKLIVAPDSPRFGTNFSFGAEGSRACVCPRLVWAPDRPSSDPDYVYPLVGYIARNYHPVMRSAGTVILEPNGEQLH